MLPVFFDTGQSHSTPRCAEIQPVSQQAAAASSNTSISIHAHVACPRRSTRAVQIIGNTKQSYSRNKTVDIFLVTQCMFERRSAHLVHGDGVAQTERHHGQLGRVELAFHRHSARHHVRVGHSLHLNVTQTAHSHTTRTSSIHRLHQDVTQTAHSHTTRTSSIHSLHLNVTQHTHTPPERHLFTVST